MDACLYIRGNEWKNFEEKLRTFPLTNKDARALKRFFLARATECELDKQGRFLINSNLREFAGLEKWLKYSEEENLAADEIAERIENLGI